jgi:hypothetical protein
MPVGRTPIGESKTFGPIVRTEMKRNVLYGGCAALLLAIAIGPAEPPPMPAPQPPGPAQHGVINPHRHADGTLKRGPRNEFYSGNWSGYAVATYQTGQTYSSASATWQVPSVSYAPYNGTPTEEWVANWVGIGGFCQNASCTSVDPTLIQLGTFGAVVNSGGTTYVPWYELLPGYAQAIPYSVKPGDIISASLQCTVALANPLAPGNTVCSPSTTQTWVLAMSDQTAGWQWSETFQYQTGMGSAEWVTEAPYSGGIVPLPDYVQANFEPISANGANPNLTLAANGIAMEDPWGQTSNPSNPVGGNWFGTCWGNGTLTPCTAATSQSPPSSAPTPPAAPAPTAALGANPTTVSFFQQSTLTWSSTNATSCTGGGFDTWNATSGSTMVRPFGTTTYSLTCSGTGGSATTDATIHVSGSSSGL